MNEERQSFTFYLSFEKAISRLDDNSQLSVYRAISRYSLFGEQPNVDGLAAVAWELVKPILNKARVNSINGRKAKGVAKPSLLGNSNARKEAKTKRKQSENEAKTIQDTYTYTKTNTINSIGTKSKRFVPPTKEEVETYIREKGYSLDAEKFLAYYESNGWKVGKNPMKDWRAAVRTWSRNGYSTNNQKQSEVGRILNNNNKNKYNTNELW